MLLQYDPKDWRQFERPLVESAPHREGPAEPDGKFFVFTGNTRYGVQNLEYDPWLERWFLGVYTGSKPQYPNYSLFAVDAKSAPTLAPLQGLGGEQGLLVPLAADGLEHAATGDPRLASEGRRRHPRARSRALLPRDGRRPGRQRDRDAEAGGVDRERERPVRAGHARLPHRHAGRHERRRVRRRSTLSLTLDGAATFGAFAPGIERDYTAGTAATVTSTAGDATLSVSEPGHLTNGPFRLASPLAVELSRTAWSAPVSNDRVAVTFKQHIGSSEPLRTGDYGHSGDAHAEHHHAVAARGARPAWAGRRTQIRRG